jgi:hypothetical protein
MGKKKQPEPTPTPTPAATGGGSSGPTGPYDQVLQGYSNFANTGGFSPADLANIRARAVSPVRATYANAERNVNRQRAIQGGYSPNYTAAMSRMAREQGQTTADAATNAEAGISEQVQQGKLAGLQGLSGLIGSGSGGGGGGESPENIPVVEKKKGFWGKVGGALKGIGKIALPIALSAIPGGTIAGKGLAKIGAGGLTDR